MFFCDIANMSNHLSRKIKLLSALSVIMVVFVHSFNLYKHTPNSDGVVFDGYNLFIQHFFSQGIARLGVPFFFMFSGYWFFKQYVFSASVVLDKYKKRIQSLGVPYLFWSALGLLLLALMQRQSNLPASLSEEALQLTSWKYVLDKLLIHPIAYQLWFLRDLILCVLCSPLLYLLLKYIPKIAILLTASVWFFNCSIGISNQSFCFFLLGAYFRLSTYQEPIIQTNTRKLLLAIWLLLLLLQTALMQMSLQHRLLIDMLHSTTIVFGLASVWLMYDVWMEAKFKATVFLEEISKYSFFIYLAHEPLLSGVKKGLFLLFRYSYSTTLVVYFLSPVLVLALLYFFAVSLKRWFPKIYFFTTGGR
jgi:surface polysaccharide O-acyltransferase-like enzyme